MSYGTRRRSIISKYFIVLTEDGELLITEKIASLMNEMLTESFGDTFHGKRLRIANVRLPWGRLFETDFDIVEVE